MSAANVLLGLLFLMGIPAFLALGLGSFVLGGVLLTRFLRSSRRNTAGALFALTLVALAWAAWRYYTGARLLEAFMSGVFASVFLVGLNALLVIGVVGGMCRVVRGSWPTRFKVAVPIGLIGIAVCQVQTFQASGGRDPSGTSEAAAAFSCIWLGAWTIAVLALAALAPRDVRLRLLRPP